LFDPRVLKHVPGSEATLFGHSEKEKERNPVMSVSEAASHVLGRAEVEQRQYLLGSPNAAGGLLTTGDMTGYIKGEFVHDSTVAFIPSFVSFAQEWARSLLYCLGDISSRTQNITS
jgi:hypothetical protein